MISHSNSIGVPKNLPELLMPAGSRRKAQVALDYGADAVYMGIPLFSLRTRENRVTEADILEIIAYAHAKEKKVYITVNGFPHEFAIPEMKKHLQFVETSKADGIIFADLGVLALAKEFAPSIPKHLSVQTSTVNIPAMKMWMELGVERVILAREMSIREVAKVHEALPNLELEYFVHGAVCMAYSGRCLLSNFTGGRDANRGACNHTCRWNYRVFDEEGRIVDVSEHEREISNDKPPLSNGFSQSLRDFEKLNFWEEEERKGQIIPVEEDFHGTHIMSSRDMCMIAELDKVIAGGVCSLKVEGRNKTEYYAATIARAYRRALDDFAVGKPFDENLWEEIHATANRGFFPGFLNGKPRSGDVKYDANSSKANKEFCGVVEKWENGRIFVNIKNRIDEGNMLEVVMPKMKDDFSFVAEEMKFGNESRTVLHGGDINKISSLRCEREVPPGVFLRQKAQNAGIKKTAAEMAAESYAV